MMNGDMGGWFSGMGFGGWGFVILILVVVVVAFATMVASRNKK